MTSQDGMDALGRDWHVLFHKVWTASACGKPYVKEDWHNLDRIASRIMAKAKIAPPFGLPRAGERVDMAALKGSIDASKVEASLREIGFGPLMDGSKQ